mgnify:CR=1 FL=1
MKVYLVGGAVRDLVMNLPVKDKDYVVVGSTVEEMLSLGFQQVGADFAVFLFGTAIFDTPPQANECEFNF